MGVGGGGNAATAEGTQDKDSPQLGWEVQVFEGVCWYLQGNITEMSSTVARLRERDAPRCNTPAALAEAHAQRLWSVLLTLLAAVHGTDVMVMRALLDEAQALVRASTDNERHWFQLVTQQQMLLHALAGVVHSRHGAHPVAVAAAKEALQRLSFQSGNPFFPLTYVTLVLCADVLAAAKAAAPVALPAARADEAHLLQFVLSATADQLDKFARCVGVVDGMSDPPWGAPIAGRDAGADGRMSPGAACVRARARQNVRVCGAAPALGSGRGAVWPRANEGRPGGTALGARLCVSAPRAVAGSAGTCGSAAARGGGGGRLASSLRKHAWAGQDPNG